MAEDKKADDGTAEAAAPKKSKKTLMLVLIGVVALGGAGAAGFLLKGGSQPAAATDETAGTEAESKPAAGLVPMDTFLVNLNDPEGDRFMKLTLRLTISPESVAGEVTEDPLLLARLRDRILTVLTAKTFMELVSPLGKENLRQEIQAQLGPLLASGEVQDVLFSEFVVQ